MFIVTDFIYLWNMNKFYCIYLMECAYHHWLEYRKHMEIKIISVERLWVWISNLLKKNLHLSLNSNSQCINYGYLLQCCVICHFYRIHHIFQAIKCLKIMQQWCMLLLFFFANVWITFSSTKQGWFINWKSNNILQQCVSMEASFTSWF